LTLIPDYFDSITGHQVRKTVKGVEFSESGGPVEIAPTMGGENNGARVVFRGTKVGNPPDTLFEDFFPVGAFVYFSFNPNFVDEETIFFGE